MKEFTKLHLSKYGKAVDLVKGACGWGSEGWTFDRTGAKKVYRNVIEVDSYSNPNWTYYRCVRKKVCDNIKTNC